MRPPFRDERSHMKSGGGRHELPDSELPAPPGHLWFFDGYGQWFARPVIELLVA